MVVLDLQDLLHLVFLISPFPNEVMLSHYPLAAVVCEMNF